jgi:poly-gamma-glutamate synthesis protein (capsule biosynthesis protein)
MSLNNYKLIIKTFIFWLASFFLLVIILFVFANYFLNKLESQFLVCPNESVGVVDSELGIAELISKAESQPVVLMAVGDIMLSRNVGTEMFKSHDYTLPFSKTADILVAADITFGNLESPFYNRGWRITQGMIFKAEPEAIAGLKLAGFDVLSLANNHIMNQGSAGLTYTLDYLKENDILTVGAGRDFNAAHTPTISKINDTNFGFLAYSYVDYHDSADQKDVVSGLNIEQAKKDLEALRSQVDVVIVSFHAGDEYTVKPNQSQKDFAHAVIEAGADLVIGHHPHWPQIIEKYQDKWIFYSLGNFVFDQEWSQETKEGLILKAVWQDKKLKELSLMPVIIENYSTPRLADSQESQKIFDRIGVSGPIIFSQ